MYVYLYNCIPVLIPKPGQSNLRLSGWIFNLSPKENINGYLREVEIVNMYTICTAEWKGLYK